jgi:hypothetical protein
MARTMRAVVLRADLRRQVDALRAYRASFSADQLGAAWVQHDPQGRDGQELQARVRAIEAMSLEDQAQVNDLGTRREHSSGKPRRVVPRQGKRHDFATRPTISFRKRASSRSRSGRVWQPRSRPSGMTSRCS